MSIEIFPQNSKSSVNRAGLALAKDSATDADLAVIENWRAAHNHILNTFQANLRRRAKNSNAKSPVQRIKRLDTIRNKLQRFPKMNLARMHDIVGCRVVFDDLEQLNNFRQKFNKSRFYHRRRTREDASDLYDYISNPKKSGYRGIHDVFEYRSKQSGAEKVSGGDKWNGLHIEVQYRTSVQHAWATAVEICDKFTDNHGKFSNAPDEYLRYFVLASELLSRAYEATTPRQLELTNREIVDEFLDLEDQHGMLRTLRGIQPSQEKFNASRNTLLIFNEKTDEIDVVTFPDFRTAMGEYFRLEREKDEQTDVVLVAADDPESVRFGFQNYFSDAREFVKLVENSSEILLKK